MECVLREEAALLVGVVGARKMEAVVGARADAAFKRQAVISRTQGPLHLIDNSVKRAVRRAKMGPGWRAISEARTCQVHQRLQLLCLAWHATDWLLAAAPDRVASCFFRFGLTDQELR